MEIIWGIPIFWDPKRIPYTTSNRLNNKPTPIELSITPVEEEIVESNEEILPSLDDERASLEEELARLDARWERKTDPVEQSTPSDSTLQQLEDSLDGIDLWGIIMGSIYPL